MSGTVIQCDTEPSGFKSMNCPAQIKELETFKKDLLDIVKSIKFRNTNNKFHLIYLHQQIKQKHVRRFTDRIQKVIKAQQH